jgi:hypothetical protein
MPKPHRLTPLFVAAACLCAACRSEPKAEPARAVPPPSTSPASVADAGRAFVVTLPDAGAVVAPTDGGFSELAGMWHGKMTAPAASPAPGGGNGIRDREVMMRIGPEGVVGIAIRPFKAADSFARMGASAMCTIDGTIGKRGEKTVFIEHQSRCRAQIAYPRELGLKLKEPCALSVVSLDKGGGEGEVFALRRRGCKTDGDL